MTHALDSDADGGVPNHGERLDTAPALHDTPRPAPPLPPERPRPSSATVTSLMTYMPTATAVGYPREPDMELPLPGNRMRAHHPQWCVRGTR
ncbi:protein of unknown function [Streptomyces sp. KY75]|nr:protein of unknown function [Streptomyces sp. KY75]CAD5991277.1 protein of unknown function [Streptomyces sp. KY70]